MRSFHPVTSLALVALLGLAGCSSLSVSSRTYPDAPPYPPTDPSQVALLQSDPSIPFVRLGEVTVSLDGNPSQPDIASALVKRAALMGATAVVVVYSGAANMGVMYSGALWTPVDPTQANQPVVIGVAIHYT